MSARKTTPRLGIVAVMAVAAVMVAGAVGASTASANEFMSKTSMTHLLVLQLATQELLVITGAQLNCSTVHALTLISALLTPTVLAAPVYSGCELVSGSTKTSATVNMKECAYVFHAGTGTGTSLSVGTVDIECSTGHEIEMTAGTCTIKEAAQTGLEDVHYSLESGSLVEITPLIKAIKYTVSSGFLCSLTGGTFANGTYKGLLHASVTEGGPMTEV